MKVLVSFTGFNSNLPLLNPHVLWCMTSATNGLATAFTRLNADTQTLIKHGVVMLEKQTDDDPPWRIKIIITFLKPGQKEMYWEISEHFYDDWDQTPVCYQKLEDEVVRTTHHKIITMPKKEEVSTV